MPAGAPRKIQDNPPSVRKRADQTCDCGTCHACVKREGWRRWWHAKARTKLKDPIAKEAADERRIALSGPTDEELDRRATAWLQAHSQRPTADQPRMTSALHSSTGGC